MSTRDELKTSAHDLGWDPINNGERHIDIYRSQPYSIMVEFSRDGMVIHAHLFTDPPELRQRLSPRVLKSVTKFDDNKRRRIRGWLYHYRTPQVTG